MKPRNADQYRFWGFHPALMRWDPIAVIDMRARLIHFYDGDYFPLTQVNPRLELGFGDFNYKPLREGDVVIGKGWRLAKVVVYYQGRFYFSDNTVKPTGRLVTLKSIENMKVIKIGTLDEHPNDWQNLS